MDESIASIFRRAREGPLLPIYVFPECLKTTQAR